MSPVSLGATQPCGGRSCCCRLSRLSLSPPWQPALCPFLEQVPSSGCRTKDHIYINRGKVGQEVKIRPLDGKLLA